jgi:endonuclease YncB( thermonuclease family)
LAKRRRTTKPKYTIGSLLILLAFLFYIACNTKEEKEAKPHNEKRETEIKKPRRSNNKSYSDVLSAFEGKVVGVKDGDTFEVLYDGQSERIRLADIDCPENSQPFGKAAKKFASDLCYGKTVIVIPKKKRDQYGRILGIVMTKDSLNVNEELIRSGMAWRYKYSKNKALNALENEARAQRKGLWADEDPINPWQWRKDKGTGYNRN